MGGLYLQLMQSVPCSAGCGFSWNPLPSSPRSGNLPLLYGLIGTNGPVTCALVKSANYACPSHPPSSIHGSHTIVSSNEICSMNGGTIWYSWWEQDRFPWLVLTCGTGRLWLRGWGGPVNCCLQYKGYFSSIVNIVPHVYFFLNIFDQT